MFPSSSTRRTAGVAFVGAVCLLVALVLGPTPAAAAPAGAPSATGADHDPASRERGFAQAAREFGVPQSVLEAVSYAQTRWEGHSGQHSTDGGYGPMNLVDGTLFAADRAAGRDGSGPASVAGSATPASAVDTLGRAAALLGVGRDVLRREASANIRGGAALLAQRQRSLSLPAGATSDPGQWYATVAAASGSGEEAVAAAFADDVYAVLAAGVTRATSDGKAVRLAPTAAVPQRAQLARLGLHRSKPNPNVECPRSLDCEWVPAPYADLGGGHYGNHDLAARDTAAGPEVDYIVIHDTEASWDTTLQLVQDPTYVSWHYSLRSADGHVAQHVATKDVAWHAGNWYVNGHSVGLEHEGFAAAGATWYTESLYRSSAKLVRYLTARYDIPRDRAHILGHDQVPGTTPASVRGMHWDPGPYWDWEHYFDLLGAPLSGGGGGGDERARRGDDDRRGGDIVRILPGFRGNVQQVTGCTAAGVACAPQGTNFLYLHTGPSESAPLVRDVGLHPDGSPATTDVADIGARVTAGVEYAVAQRRQGDWTAVWYLGQEAWFLNPRRHPSAIRVSGSLVVPKAGLASVPLYGRAYPEASAYGNGIPVQPVVPLQYAIPAGQRAVLSDASVVTDYYRAATFATLPPADHVDVVGTDRYYQVSYGHRIGFVRAADVDVIRTGEREGAG